MAKKKSWKMHERPPRGRCRLCGGKSTDWRFGVCGPDCRGKKR